MATEKSEKLKEMISVDASGKKRPWTPPRIRVLFDANSKHKLPSKLPSNTERTTRWNAYKDRAGS